MKKIFFLFSLCSLLFFSGCAAQQGTIIGSGEGSENIVGGTDSDGFVKLPGEPSRNDPGHYYVVEDVCAQFTEKFIEGISGKEVVKTKMASYDPQYTCTYYTSFDEAKGYGPFFSIALGYFNAEKQKKGHEILGRTIRTNPDIKMDHFLVIQDDGLINEVYLILNPDKIITVNRSSAKVMTEEELTQFAVKLAEKIKNFK